MPRFPRVVATDTPHHVTQRGNAQRWVFETDSDRLVYLDLLRRNCQAYDLAVLGYCLMSNHVHLVVIPHRLDSMAIALRHTHGRYAAYLNGRQAATGHIWQGRFYSCPLDTHHLWAALRYIELNPVRAALTRHPAHYAWSSAAAHCGRSAQPVPLVLAQYPWHDAWTPAAWREFLIDSTAEQDAAALRACTHTGRPLGTEEFVESLERTLQRALTPGQGGRPRQKPGTDGTFRSHQPRLWPAGPAE